eukprot:3324344-Amphidinium_carterae.2
MLPIAGTFACQVTEPRDLHLFASCAPTALEKTAFLVGPPILEPRLQNIWRELGFKAVPHHRNLGC